jgi:hypothetical protein
VKYSLKWIPTTEILEITDSYGSTSQVYLKGTSTAPEIYTDPTGSQSSLIDQADYGFPGFSKSYLDSIFKYISTNTTTNGFSPLQGSSLVHLAPSGATGGATGGTTGGTTGGIDVLKLQADVNKLKSTEARQSQDHLDSSTPVATGASQVFSSVNSSTQYQSPQLVAGTLYAINPSNFSKEELSNKKWLLNNAKTLAQRATDSSSLNALTSFSDSLGLGLYDFSLRHKFLNFSRRLYYRSHEQSMFNSCYRYFSYNTSLYSVEEFEPTSFAVTKRFRPHLEIIFEASKQVSDSFNLSSTVSSSVRKLLWLQGGVSDAFKTIKLLGAY